MRLLFAVLLVAQQWAEEGGQVQGLRLPQLLPRGLIQRLADLQGSTFAVREPTTTADEGQRRYSTQTPGKLILIRHGESVLSESDAFSGWIDSDISSEGRREMEHAGRLMLERGYVDVDVVYTSRLKRSIRSAWVLLKELNQIFRPLQNSWRLNQRHFGAMEGKSKQLMATEVGEDRVQEYRNSLYLRPPPMEPNHPHWHQDEGKYMDLSKEEIPVGESIYDCMQRTIPFYQETLVPDLLAGKTVMVVAHANSLRGIIKQIDRLTAEQVQQVQLPNGIPLVYKFDNQLRPIDQASRHRPLSAQFLESPKALKLLMEKEKSWGNRDAEQYKGLYSLVDYESPTLIHPAASAPLMNGLFLLEKEREAMEAMGDGIAKQGGAPRAVPAAAAAAAVQQPAADLGRGEGGGVKVEDGQREGEGEEMESTISGQYVVFIRHGQTEYNKLGIFTGWDDAPLAAEGREQAVKAGKLLKKHGMTFDVVYTSWLSRAIETAWAVVDELDLLWLPIVKSWRLNERMYGALTGMSKKGIAEKYGEKQLKSWRRGYAVQPPPVNSFSFSYPGNDDRYFKHVSDLRISIGETVMRSIAKGRFEVHRKFPKTESLRDCMLRTIPLYQNVIVPEAVMQGKNVLIASSENAIRGLLMHLCDIPRERIHEIDIPNGLPLIFCPQKKCIQLLDDGNETDEDFANPLRRYHFGESPELLFKPCNYENDEDATQCFFGENGKSYAYDPIIRLRPKKRGGKL